MSWIEIVVNRVVLKLTLLVIMNGELLVLNADVVIDFKW